MDLAQSVSSTHSFSAFILRAEIVPLAIYAGDLTLKTIKNCNQKITQQILYL